MKDQPDPRLALVHEWLVSYAGSERVVEALAELWPTAPIHTTVHDPAALAGTGLAERTVIASHLNRWPGARRFYQQLLPFMPAAVERFDLSAYDVVVSSHHAVAKGVLTRADQLHVCYVHSPMRYAWDLHHQYLASGGALRGLRNLIARPILHRLRQWDVATAARVDLFVANSACVARRIEKTWRRPALVLPPPVDVAAFAPGTGARGDFFVAASRLVAYKRMDVVVAAFASRPDLRLVVIGDGPERARLQALAGGNTTFLGHAPHAVLKDHLQRARALVFAAEEDFGILPVEAMACGTPVIAYGRGGACETVLPGLSGLWFDAQTPASIAAALARFAAEEATFSPERIRAHAEGFARPRFQARFRALLANAWSAFRADGPLGPERAGARLLGEAP